MGQNEIWKTDFATAGCVCGTDSAGTISNFKTGGQTMPRRRNEADDAARLAAYARACGYELQRRGVTYFLTKDSELGCSGDLDRIELFLRNAIAEHREAIMLSR